MSSDQFTYDWLAADPEFWMLAMQKMLTLLSESVDVIFNGEDPVETAVLSKNLYADGSIYEEGELPYFWLLLGHQETLWPLTAALDKTRMAKLPFASAYFFEFFTYENDDYVSVNFRDDKEVIHDIELPCSRSLENGVQACEALEF